jgi:hypothetical protein
MSFRAIFVLIVTAAAALSSRPAAAQTFTVHSDQIICDKWVGFGAQMNPWTYCEPNKQDVNEENVKDFEAKVIALRPQHVRVFALPKWYEDDFDPSVRQSVARVCKLAGKAGASVNITYWGGDSNAELGRRNAHMIEKMIREDGLGGIVRYVTLQNEPNSTKMTLVRYNELYTSFDKTLREMGLRNQIEIVGGDLLSDNQHKWFDNLTNRLAPILDGYSVHMYSDYWDHKHIIERLEGVTEIVNAMPSDVRRPMYLMEFGLRGQRKERQLEPGRFEDGRESMDVPYVNMLNGWVIMEAINRGYCAAVQWDMVDVFYDRPRMRYGLIGEPDAGWPLKPGYFLMELFTHATEPGWQTMKVTGSADKRVVAAMKGPKGEWSVFALNRDNQPLPITLNGLPSNTTFDVVCWNANGDGKLSNGTRQVTDATGRIAIGIAKESLISLKRVGN